MVTIIKKGTPKAEIKTRMKAALSNMPKKSMLEFAGTLKSKVDPLAYQMRMRDEWE